MEKKKGGGAPAPEMGQGPGGFGHAGGHHDDGD